MREAEQKTASHDEISREKVAEQMAEVITRGWSKDPNLKFEVFLKLSMSPVSIEKLQKIHQEILDGKLDTLKEYGPPQRLIDIIETAFQYRAEMAEIWQGEGIA